MYNIFIKMFSALLTVGGVGLINYIIAEQLDAVDITQQGSNREKALAIIFSMFDLLLYLIVEAIGKVWFSGTVLIIVTILATSLISIGLTVLLANKFNKLFYSLINKIRGHNNKSFRSSETVWQHALEAPKSKSQLVYLYDFEHNPLGFGWRTGISNDLDSNYAIELLPQYDKGDPEPQPTYEEITKLIQQENYLKDFDVKQFVSFKQRFIVIIANCKCN